ncbi:MAG: thymidylate synthase, partial [Candidatus Nanohaloarchaea archaeon]
HVPGLLEQLTREPKERPSIRVADKDIDDLTYDDIEVVDYDSHDGIRFKVAE